MGHSPDTQRPPTAIVKVCYQGLIWRIPTLDYNPNTTVQARTLHSLGRVVERDAVAAAALACDTAAAC